MKRALRGWFCLVVLAGSLPLWAQRDENRYALILNDPPLSAQASTRKQLRALPRSAGLQIETAQRSLKAVLAQRKIPVTGSVATLANAVFVRAAASRVPELRALPGVKGVVQLHRYRRTLDQAVNLVNAPQAWNVVGGLDKAGAGIKIGIIDTGIDQNHPAFQDSSLSVPAGYPRCRDSAGECAFTNNKVIAARSYVDILAAGDTTQDPSVQSRPDDLSPRDRVGHGTAAAMIAAGVRNAGPSATITGIAPKAWLGNYKIFGSPGVNDSTYGDAFIQALNDAFNDGMDIVTVSLGWTATYGPLDTGAVCGQPSGVECDLEAQTAEAAMKQGMVVVAAAGNDGDIGNQFPTLGTVSSPGTAPSVITVGASTNSHIWFSTVRVTGDNVPSNLQQVPGRFGDGPKPNGPLTAPLRDVAQLQDDGKACHGLSSGSLNGALALIQRGDCSFATKVNAAQQAGAVGVVMYQVEGDNSIFYPALLAQTGIPTVLISNDDGKRLKSFIASQPDRPVTLDPTVKSFNAQFDTVADFSSHGPDIDLNLKPEVVAVGTDLYTATQKYDPNGDLYNPSGYIAADGTSFAVPMVAGVAALVLQQNANIKSTAQVKSAVVNTASPQVQDDAGTARVTAMGAGKLNAEAAVKTTVAVDPAVASFGVVTLGMITGQGSSGALHVSNIGSDIVRLNLAIAPHGANPLLSVTPPTLAVSPGQSQDVAVRLSGGTLPAAGSYEGVITITGGAVDLRVPYMYLVGDGVPYSIYPVIDGEFVGNVGDPVPGFCQCIAFKVLDRYGVPVSRASVQFKATVGGGQISSADAATDIYGIAAANATLGSSLGEQQFTGTVGNLTTSFSGRARLRPTIETNGIMNAASYEQGKAVAPGSYIAIFGRGLSDSTRVFSSPYLPLSLAGVSVSFDVPSKSLSLPGRLHFVSDGQVNVQVPWELQGLNSVFVKVSIGYESQTAVYTLPLADSSPALFEYTEGSGRQFIAALDENYRVIGSDNPAQRGRTVQLYANGLGPVDHTPADGEVSPADPLARTRVTPTVTIGGRPATVQFSGLAPFIVGLYQINVVVPNDVSAGIQPVVVDMNGVVSKSANLMIQ